MANTSSVTLFRDQQHAARMFVDDGFKLAPKFNFLFHVSFSVNNAALTNKELEEKHSKEINMLVKNCDLPNYQIKYETLNQYNRKKNVQNSISYQPINITFHDDNIHIINKLWYNYYRYYYADTRSAEKELGAYSRNATLNYKSIENFKYGYNPLTQQQKPFFEYIKIYQMALHEYVEYKLYKPIIISWNHNKVDYASSNIHDNSMTIAYEAVQYDYGKVADGKPEGFGAISNHYDTTKAPNPYNTTESSPKLTTNIPENITNNAIVNTAKSNDLYQNAPNPQVPAGISGLTSIVGQTLSNGTSGFSDILFPGTTTQNIEPNAFPVNF